MYHRSGTVDRIASGQLADASACAKGASGRQADAVCALTRWQHCSV